MGNELIYRTQAKPFTKGRPSTNVEVYNSLLDVAINLGNHPLLIVDENLVNESDVARMFTQTKKNGGEIVRLQVGKSIKEYTVYLSLKKQLENTIHDVVLIVGGGTTINVGLYLTDDLNIINTLSPVIIPANTMSLVDVAIGSLGLLNKDGVKNKLRAVCDPVQVIISRDLFESAPLALRTDGMIEVMKHALFQDDAILESSTAAYLNRGDKKKYFELAIYGMKLKINLQNATIGGNESLKRLLTYGHLHAHLLEEYFNYKIPHSLGVYLGLLIDLKLAGPIDADTYLFDALEGSQKKNDLVQMLLEIKIDKLRDLYSHQSKYINNETDDFYVVKLSELGCYKDLNKTVDLSEHSFEEIAEVYKSLKEKL